VGFAVLATSRFIPTVYFGALVTLAMLGGLVGNLFVLPLLIQAFVIGRKPAAE
jgi:predicted RND superfamily exporter protein